MNNFQKIAMVSGFLLCLSTSVVVAESHHPPKTLWTQERLIELKSSLSLSDAQVQQIDGIVKEIKQKEKPKEPIEMMRRMHGVDEKIKAVLTDEQKIKYEAFKNQLKESRKAEMKKRMLEHMTKELKLSSDQASKLGALFDSFHGQMTALMDEKNTQKEFHDKVRDLMQKQDEGVKAVLTEEQFVKFKEMKKHFRKPEPQDHDRH